MREVRIAVAFVVVLSSVAGLVRAARGPSLADRILAIQLFGTTAIAALLLFSADEGRSVLLRVALVVALLASITVIAFVRTPPSGGRSGR